MTQEITNFRSLGGYQAQSGTVREDKLFRSGQLNGLSSQQIDYLANQLKISRIVDMRGAEEREQFPDSTWADVNYQAIDILKDATKNNASLSRMITNGGNVYDNMMMTYEQLADSNSAITGYQKFLKDVSTNDEPLIFHCFAGKDRTGVGAALILKTLGVDDSEIFDDYLKTNELRKTANQQILDSIKNQATDEELLAVSQALKVNTDYLAHFFETVNNHAGSFEDYLHTTLQLDKDFENRMFEMYVK
ncbi:tyrosine-protein phosphatase [Lentilactobacillus sp. SPB1-3]|uniref:Tyrosine-protein phosphatase n=1 Tax=Lentilactobacillus terminaliae TaxID=3003483 RepID=A0ACD5DCR6_9LACO|nr:tyrosine-protein phosphatase [Lentilactobacillus sp. SPB1-3]MCZ0977976.1 tyrosine-protein phosphatase [Lentilactobacillus sp. SPB1-3]